MLRRRGTRGFQVSRATRYSRSMEAHLDRAFDRAPKSGRTDRSAHGVNLNMWHSSPDGSWEFRLQHGELIWRRCRTAPMSPLDELSTHGEISDRSALDEGSALRPTSAVFRPGGRMFLTEAMTDIGDLGGSGAESASAKGSSSVYSDEHVAQLWHSADESDRVALLRKFGRKWFLPVKFRSGDTLHEEDYLPPIEIGPTLPLACPEHCTPGGVRPSMPLPKTATFAFLFLRRWSEAILGFFLAEERKGMLQGHLQEFVVKIGTSPLLDRLLEIRHTDEGVTVNQNQSEKEAEWARLWLTEEEFKAAQLLLQILLTRSDQSSAGCYEWEETVLYPCPGCMLHRFFDSKRREYPTDIVGTIEGSFTSEQTRRREDPKKYIRVRSMRKLFYDMTAQTSYACILRLCRGSSHTEWRVSDKYSVMSERSRVETFGGLRLPYAELAIQYRVGSIPDDSFVAAHCQKDVLYEDVRLFKEWSHEGWVYTIVKQLNRSLPTLPPQCMIELYDFAVKHKCANLLPEIGGNPHWRVLLAALCDTRMNASARRVQSWISFKSMLSGRAAFHGANAAIMAMHSQHLARRHLT